MHRPLSEMHPSLYVMLDVFDRIRWAPHPKIGISTEMNMQEKRRCGN